MGRAVDLFVTYRFLKLLTTPFEKTEAYKKGIIDKDEHHNFSGEQHTAEGGVDKDSFLNVVGEHQAAEGEIDKDEWQNVDGEYRDAEGGIDPDASFNVLVKELHSLGLNVELN